MKRDSINFLKLRQALESSWQPDTAYLEVEEKGNPALGQCYPTSRVVQYFLPESEIVEGEVQTAKGIEKHFWNLLIVNGLELHIDYSWQQFPSGSSVKSWKIRDKNTLNDSEKTLTRVETLLSRVKQQLLSI
jgi:hypothetical protein